MHPPLSIAEQGSFAFGGRTTHRQGRSWRGDHGYVRYQVPVSPRRYPLLLWHGGSTSGSCWESTPDGREGFESLLVRLSFSVYIIDQPRKGRGGSAPEPAQIEAERHDDAASWNIWRLGIWEPPGRPQRFSNLQLPGDDKTIDQFLRRRTPGNGPPDHSGDVTREAVCELLDQLGPTVLVVHSNSGQHAWQLRHRNVAGVVAYEPGAFVFPSDELPSAVETDHPDVARITKPIAVPAAEFGWLTERPIQLVYGDNIGKDRPSDNIGVELWRVNLRRARQFEAIVNRRGGDAALLELPSIGLIGNTHFPFSDLNNQYVAQAMLRYLEGHRLA